MDQYCRRGMLLSGLFAAAFSLIGCGDGGETPADMNTDSATDSNPCPGAITFPDSNLEALIRSKIDKPNGDIEYEDVREVTELSAVSENISDLTNIQCLDQLTILDLYINQIDDLTPLANLPSLVDLNVSFNHISDLSPLANLTSLAELDLSNNQISDLNALANLTNLTALYLESNQISDLSPLLDNTGLGNEDEVYVKDNLLNCKDPAVLQQIATLEDRGVYLVNDCTTL